MTDTYVMADPSKFIHVPDRALVCWDSSSGIVLDLGPAPVKVDDVAMKVIEKAVHDLTILKRVGDRIVFNH
jgi:hypothetical protein